MATTGLFGMSPYELQQQRETELNTAANAYAQLDPFQAARASLYKAGSQVGGGIAGLMGVEDPGMKKVSDLQALQKQFDMTTPEGLISAGNQAIKLGHVNEGIAAITKAQEMANKTADTAHKTSLSKKESAQADLELMKVKQQVKTAGMTNLPPEVQAILLQESRDPNFDAAAALKKYSDTAGKADWSDPYKLDGATVQRNSKTGEVRTAVSRAPVVQVGISDDSNALIAQAITEGRLGPGQVNSRNAKIIAGVLKQNPTANLLEMNVDALGAAAAGKSLSVQTAKMGTAAAEARPMITIVKNIADTIDKTEYPTINAIANAVNKGTGDTKIVRLNTSINALINSYSRAISPTGTPTVSDKEHAREVINAAYSNGQLNAILDTMTQEMDIAKNAASETTKLLKDTREAAKGRGGQTYPAGYTLHIDANGNKAMVSPDGKSFIEVK